MMTRYPIWQTAAHRIGRYLAVDGNLFCSAPAYPVDYVHGVLSAWEPVKQHTLDTVHSVNFVREEYPIGISKIEKTSVLESSAVTNMIALSEWK